MDSSDSVCVIYFYKDSDNKLKLKKKKLFKNTFSEEKLLVSAKFHVVACVLNRFKSIARVFAVPYLLYHLLFNRTSVFLTFQFQMK